MNTTERSLMRSMVSILNEASYEPILTEEQFNTRLEDLKQFEKETNFTFMNSPTCRDKIRSIVEFEYSLIDDFKRCNDIKNIIEFANQKEMLIHPNLIGEKVKITYVDGIMKTFKISNIVINFNGIGKNIPYKIDKKGVYIVEGILSLSKDLNFYVVNIVDGGNNETIFDNLKEAEKLGFDIVPYWIISVINPKKFDNNIDYIDEYANEEELHYNGIVFKFNNIEHGKNGIIYNVIK